MQKIYFIKKTDFLTDIFLFRLTAPVGERIEIEFVDFLLFNNDAEECAEQGLSIRDPAIETLIGKYCGNTKPPNYSTMDNALFLYLSSSTDGEYKVVKNRHFGQQIDILLKNRNCRSKF